MVDISVAFRSDKYTSKQDPTELEPLYFSKQTAFLANPSSQTESLQPPEHLFMEECSQTDLWPDVCDGMELVWSEELLLSVEMRCSSGPAGL